MESIPGDIPCPSVLTVASCEADGLAGDTNAAVKAHVRGCLRCGRIIRDLGELRGALLGASALDRAHTARRAAEEILGCLRQERTWRSRLEGPQLFGL